MHYNAELSPASREWLWKRIIDDSNKENKLSYLDDLTLFSKPADYHISDTLLEACLESKNERMRAMGQHIYRKLGKSPDEKLLEKWAEDPSFLVRAHAAMLAPECISPDDPSPFVRLIRGLNNQHGGSRPADGPPVQ